MNVDAAKARRYAIAAFWFTVGGSAVGAFVGASLGLPWLAAVLAPVGQFAGGALAAWAFGEHSR